MPGGPCWKSVPRSTKLKPEPTTPSSSGSELTEFTEEDDGDSVSGTTGKDSSYHTPEERVRPPPQNATDLQLGATSHENGATSRTFPDFDRDIVGQQGYTPTRIVVFKLPPDLLRKIVGPSTPGSPLTNSLGYKTTASISHGQKRPADSESLRKKKSSKKGRLLQTRSPDGNATEPRATMSARDPARSVSTKRLPGNVDANDGDKAPSSALPSVGTGGKDAAQIQSSASGVPSHISGPLPDSASDNASEYALGRAGGHALAALAALGRASVSGSNLPNVPFPDSTIKTTPIPTIKSARKSAPSTTRRTVTTQPLNKPPQAVNLSLNPPQDPVIKPDPDKQDDSNDELQLIGTRNLGHELPSNSLPTPTSSSTSASQSKRISDAISDFYSNPKPQPNIWTTAGQAPQPKPPSSQLTATQTPIPSSTTAKPTTIPTLGPTLTNPDALTDPNSTEIPLDPDLRDRLSRTSFRLAHAKKLGTTISEPLTFASCVSISAVRRVLVARVTECVGVAHFRGDEKLLIVLNQVVRRSEGLVRLPAGRCRISLDEDAFDDGWELVMDCFLELAFTGSESFQLCVTIL